MDAYDDFGNYLGPSTSAGESESDDDYMGDGGMMMAPGASSTMDLDERIDDREQQQPQSHQVVLYHDKNYFPSASDVYPGAETLVQDEDTQPLETPIIAPIKVNNFELQDADAYQQTTFEWKFLTGLMDHPTMIRNVALVGHLHHGKTSFMDMLVRETHTRFWDPQVQVRFTDNRKDEQELGLSVKCMPMSLVLPSLRGKSYLMNIMDCPGHVNFSDETTAALRLADGVIILVDAVEGVMVQTERVLKCAAQENLPIILVINKVDRLLLELKLPPTDAYHKLVHTIEEVNSVLVGCGYRDRMCPASGNVVFASALYSWSFTLPSFATLYGSRQNGSKSSKFSAMGFAKRLWGDYYLDSESGSIVNKPSDTAKERTFVQFILEPIYKIYSHILGCEIRDVAPLLGELGIFLKKKELLLDPRPLLRLTFAKLFGSSTGFVDAVVDRIPSPVGGAKLKVENSYTGDVTTSVGQSLIECDPNGPLMIMVTKLYPRSDGSQFDAFGRVMSGTIRVGDSVQVLRAGYTLSDQEDMSTCNISQIWVYESRYRVNVNRVCAGNWALFEGLDAAISKTATITTAAVHDAETFRPLSFDTIACVKVAIEPINPSELPKMLDALRKIGKSYPLAHTKIEESGEHIILGTGELYLDCVLHDLRKMYADIEIKVADPVASFSETVIDTSSIRCFAETPNGKSKITMIAEPLDQGLAQDIETGTIRLSVDKASVAAFFQEKYNWDVLAARTVWSFGPDTNGPNILMDDTLSDEGEKRLLYSVKPSIVQGFQWGTREGPLCDEPIRNVKFKIIDANIAEQAIHRGAGQIIPTARRVVYSSFLLATPRLMEPIYSVQIQTPADCISAIYKVLARRRGHVTRELPKPGTPLFDVHAFVPVIDSFGFETDLRTHTQGQAFCLSVFDHWEIVPGDPLDKTVVLHPLEPSPPPALAREFMIKTRRRKGLSEDVTVNKFFDNPMLLELARQQQLV
uniref:Tr-type G domain-containing protein n=1 Tax=Spongospora subterranea TaxID=70186 RepID=A0A0H5QH16_9EUKA|eukprot:CRZ00922.1 hypothetical protein [Spongospora subterranea]